MAMIKPELKNEVVLESYERNAGSIRKVAEELGVTRHTVRQRLRKMGKHKKPLAAGTVTGVEAKPVQIPPRGKVKRYILTSAQNNTHIHEKVWQSLLTLAKHYDAEVLVGTYSYDQNRYGQLSVKRGKKKAHESTLWYDPKLAESPKDGSDRESYFSDERRELANGLVWCGEMNILPTAVNPLAGLESYSARKSAIFPHAKMAMRSIPTIQGEGTKLNYTTGTVTQRNYIQKREGLIAEHHHVYGGLLVEVNHDGNWWVRQLNCANDGTLYDLDLLVWNGRVTKGHHVEAITWGDLHGTRADEEVVKVSLNMLDTLKPKYQFIHDVLEGAAINPHGKDANHYRFYQWLRGLHRFDEELKRTAGVLERYNRPNVQTVVVDSNHDDPWVQRWLRDYDYRKDPANSELFLRAQSYLYSQIRAGKMPRDVNMLEWCLRDAGLKAKMKFLIADESYLICNKKIECGMHGHLGPNGHRGMPDNLSKMGRKANTAHTHSAGIYNGLYVAGTSSILRWTYNRGPSSWGHSHIVTYPNGKRSIITIYAGAWRAI